MTIETKQVPSIRPQKLKSQRVWQFPSHTTAAGQDVVSIVAQQQE
ncbi:MAG: hypothetical protein WA828_06440 [Coleofasciculaceae cyanobacterium]